jgi:Tol biopolymer transport system component
VLTIAVWGLLWRAFLGAPSKEPAVGAQGAIVFTTQGPEDATPMITVMLADGTHVRTLVPGLDPALSPNGSKIVFVRRSGSGSGIFVMDADGTDVRQLTKNPSGAEEAPSWSPDGATIVFARSTFVSTDPDPVASPARRDLYMVGATGGEAEERSCSGGPPTTSNPIGPRTAHASPSLG